MFSQQTFDFLNELAQNNNREWFEAHKNRYESDVREPALDFIAAMVRPLAEFAPHFRADARKMGGSLMRVFRDTRFSRDKTPYKTNIGIQFRHTLGKDVHAPGFYVHIAPDECLFGVGCWHPEPEVLAKIRDAIVQDSTAWLALLQQPQFATIWQQAGERLTRPPRGYAADHPAIAELKRKDFIAMSSLTAEQVCNSQFVNLATQQFSVASEYMRFLCRSIGVAY